MMSTSMTSYSNCSEISSAFQNNQLPQAGDFIDNFLDPCYDIDTSVNFLNYPETYTHILPYLDYSHSLQDSDQDFDPYPYPKRQKYWCEEDDGFDCCYYLPSDFATSFSNCCSSVAEQFQVPQVSGNGKLESGKEEERSVSAQSVAARERRRKITEKSRELGKLIPGGTKMNTAHMLQAAFKYVKYLQAQVKILFFLASVQEKKEAAHIEELQMIASAAIQEKLYMEEKCLVPEELALHLSHLCCPIP